MSLGLIRAMQHTWKQLPPHLMSRWQLRKWHRSFRVRGTEGVRTSIAEHRDCEVGDDPIVGLTQVESLETPPTGHGRAAGDNQHRTLHELLQLIENIAMCLVSYQPPNWTDYFDVYTRDMGTQTDVLRKSAAEQRHDCCWRWTLGRALGTSGTEARFFL